MSERVLDLSVKRIFDVVCSLFGLAVLLLPLLLVAVLVKLQDWGPVFYQGTRVGRNGKPFRMLKFRTMVADAESLGGLATPEGDPRVTSVGALLRKFKLDELPQLLNVLRGDMSLVGPRPEAPVYFEHYLPEERAIILSVRPGITDPCSVRFHDEGKYLVGSDNPVAAYIDRIMKEKIQMQIDYIHKRTLLTDLRTILRTISTLVMTRLSCSKAR